MSEVKNSIGLIPGNDTISIHVFHTSAEPEKLVQGRQFMHENDTKTPFSYGLTVALDLQEAAYICTMLSDWIEKKRAEEAAKEKPDTYYRNAAGALISDGLADEFQKMQDFLNPPDLEAQVQEPASTYEIYWDDLTPEKQAEMRDVYHENIDLSPLAIIEIEDDEEEE